MVANHTKSLSLEEINRKEINFPNHGMDTELPEIKNQIKVRVSRETDMVLTEEEVANSKEMGTNPNSNVATASSTTTPNSNVLLDLKPALQ